MSNPHVFISYSTQDNEFTQQLTQDLQAAGVEVWIDKHGLKAGTPDWENSIRAAIRGAYAILLVASPESRDSRYVRDELLIAEMYERSVIAIWAHGDKWPECVRMGYIGTQYADGRDKKYHDSLLETVNALRGFQSTAIVEEKASPKSLPPKFVPRNPYKGLRAFTSADKGDFFGRDKLIVELVEALKENTDTNRFLAIVGPSGSGKSSVVMAGLLPRLQSGALSGSDKWIYLEPVLPGAQPLESLAVVLANALNVTIGSVLDELDRSSRGLSLFAKQLAKGQRDTKVVLLIDQFEELFTQTTDEDKRSHFIDLLVTAATESGGQLIVLITLRADFYDRPINYPELGKLLEQHTKSVLPMTLEDLRDVIEKPSSLLDVQLKFEEGLVGDLLFEVRGQSGALPLLQFALDQLAEKRQRDMVTNSAYQEIGGVRGALAQHAEAVYLKLPSAQHQEMARVLFLRLIEPGPTEQEVTRRRAPQSELVTSDSTKTRLLNDVTLIFSNSRLVTTTYSGNIPMIEVSHEALIREWQLLNDWLRTAREDVKLQHVISRDAEEWERIGQPNDNLYRGSKLDEAERWAERNTPSRVEMNFISRAVQFETETQIYVQENTLLIEGLHKEVDTLRSLRSLSLSLSTIVESSTVAHKVVGMAMTLLNSQYAAIFQSGPSHPHPLLLEQVPEGSETLTLTQSIMVADLAREAASSGSIQIIENTRSRYTELPSGDVVYVTLVSIPIKRRDEISQVLCVGFAEEHRLTSREITTLNLLASQASAHLENASLYEEIRDADSRLRAILNSTRDGMILLDERGRILEVNPAAQRLIGINLSDHIHEQLTIVLLQHTENADETQAGYSRAELTRLARITRLSPQGITRREFTRTLNPNQNIYIEEVGSPVIDEHNQLIGRLMVLRDITEEKRKEKTLSKEA